MPVICLPKLAFPVFTLGAKGLNSTVLGCLAQDYNKICIMSCFFHFYDTLVSILKAALRKTLGFTQNAV